MNFCAASSFLVPPGMASAHDHNQPAPFGVTAVGALANATLSPTFENFGSETEPPALVASTHTPHLPSTKSARFSLKLLAVAPGGPYFFIRSM